VNRTIQDGSYGYNCPAAFPPWLNAAYGWIGQYLNGSRNFTVPSYSTSATPSLSPLEAEDCLFLDVAVPKSIFDNRNKGYGKPVLVWIYGGGYTGGSKSGYGSPAGLLERSEGDGGEGVVYVAMNYRLGALGWLSGPTFQSQGGVSNAGLYDQRLALHWIQKNIYKFGGDPNRVTVLGESAGGGSIMHQITAYGGVEEAPFQQAVPQSPAWQPLVSNQQQEQIFNTYLQYANISDLAEGRQANSTVLRIASARQIQNATYGQFVFGPAVDGVFAPQLPGQLLARGQFSKNVRVMVGHNANEGILFTPPVLNLSNVVFREQIEGAFPTTAAWPSVIDYIENELYPIGDYSDNIARASQLIAESTFTCNTFYLDKAFNNQTYSYLFAVPPGTHGEDIPYTFYNGGTAGIMQTVSFELQDYITGFAMRGFPNEVGVPYFPQYGSNASIQVLNVTGVSQIMDPTANQRCNWWQQALYY